MSSGCLPKRKKTPHFFFLLSTCCAVWDIPGVSWGRLCQLCPLPASSHPPPTHWEGRTGKRESLGAMQALLTTAKTRCVVNTALVTDPQHSTLQTALSTINSIPARASTAKISDIRREVTVPLQNSHTVLLHIVTAFRNQNIWAHL